MTHTSRSRPRKAPAKAHAGRSQTPPELIARQARVEELRQLVAAGRYKVEPQKLAMKILVRALRRDQQG